MRKHNRSRVKRTHLGALKELSKNSKDEEETTKSKKQDSEFDSPDTLDEQECQIFLSCSPIMKTFNHSIQMAIKFPVNDPEPTPESIELLEKQVYLNRARLN